MKLPSQLRSGSFERSSVPTRSPALRLPLKGIQFIMMAHWHARAGLPFEQLHEQERESGPRPNDVDFLTLSFRVGVALRKHRWL